MRLKYYNKFIDLRLSSISVIGLMKKKKKKEENDQKNRHLYYIRSYENPSYIILFATKTIMSRI